MEDESRAWTHAMPMVGPQDTATMHHIAQVLDCSISFVLRAAQRHTGQECLLVPVPQAD